MYKNKVNDFYWIQISTEILIISYILCNLDSKYIINRIFNYFTIYIICTLLESLNLIKLLELINE